MCEVPAQDMPQAGLPVLAKDTPAPRSSRIRSQSRPRYKGSTPEERWMSHIMMLKEAEYTLDVLSKADLQTRASYYARVKTFEEAVSAEWKCTMDFTHAGLFGYNVGFWSMWRLLLYSITTPTKRTASTMGFSSRQR